MRVLIDLDDIVVEFQSAWFAAFNQETGDDLASDRVTDWDAGKFITRSTPQHLYGIFCRTGFYDDLRPLPGAIEGVTSLHGAGHEIRFCSASPGPDASRAKMEWVDRHFAHLGWRGHTKVILTHDKHWVDGDVLIDDSPTNLRAWPERAIAIEYPYNRGIEGVEYAGTYRDPETAWARIVRKLGSPDSPTRTT